MNAADWHRIRELFEAALLLAPDERQRFVRHSSNGDDALVQEVFALLASDARAPTNTLSMDGVAPELMADIGDEAERSDHNRWAGARLGPWQLLSEIGRGGMGAVYLAERADGAYTQRAAVKLIRSSWDSADLLRRFLAERQILANLNHPRIARLLDGGLSDGGNPYLVLEYVDGVPIGRYCDDLQLSVADRLTLFLTVCEAVAYAHRALIVHRDLKPANILVDAAGGVKLLDFGIAKALSGSAETASRMFTPEYAAPEQVRGDAVTTGVDIYALGLLLFELLTGRRPYAQTGSTPAAYEQAILTQEPRPPSLAVLTQDQETSSYAARRELDPRGLAHRLRGDLDAIVLRALRKDPAERYATVDDLAADVQRHLRREPVQARLGNWRYVAVRFVRRHVLAVALALVAVAALAVGLGAALWQAEDARQQRDAAEDAARTSRAVADFLTKIFANADPAATDGKDPAASALLAAAVTEIDLAGDLPARERSAMYHALGTAQLARDAPALGLVMMEKALDLAGDDPTRRMRALHGVGVALNRQGLLDDSNARYTEARAWHAKHGAALDAERRELDYTQAINYISQQRMGDALSLLDELTKKLDARGEGLSELGIATSTMAIYSLGATGSKAEALARSQQLYDSVVADPKAALSKRKTIVGVHAYALMTAQGPAAGEPLFREAMALDEQIYGPGHLQTGVSINNVAICLNRQNRYDESIPLFEQVVAIRRSKLDPHHPDLAFSLVNSANAHEKAGHLEAALQRYGEAIRSYQASNQVGTQWMRAHHWRARTLERLQRFDDALLDVAALEPYRADQPYFKGEPQRALLLLEARLHEALARSDLACGIEQRLVEATEGERAEAAALAMRCRTRLGQ